MTPFLVLFHRVLFGHDPIRTAPTFVEQHVDERKVPFRQELHQVHESMTDQEPTHHAGPHFLYPSAFVLLLVKVEYKHQNQDVEKKTNR